MLFGDIITDPRLVYDYEAFVNALSISIGDGRVKGSGNVNSAAVKKARLLKQFRTNEITKERLLAAVSVDPILIDYWGENLVSDLNAATREVDMRTKSKDAIIEDLRAEVEHLRKRTRKGVKPR
jgi:hypothetical protein